MIVNNIENKNLNKTDQASQQLTKMFLVEFLKPLTDEMSDSLNLNEGPEGEFYSYLLQETLSEQIADHTTIKDAIKKYLVTNYKRD